VEESFTDVDDSHEEWKMTRKHTLVIAAGSSLALLVAAGWVGSASKSQRPREAQSSEERGTFRKQLAKAKSEGARKLRMSGLVVMYEHPKPLDEVLDKYDLVVAQPVEVKGYIHEDESITSWYRFRVLDTISRAPDAPPLPFDPPAEFLPVADDELIVPRSGGTATVEGVEVTLEESGFPEFSLGRKYVLFLQADRARKVARTELGPSGALAVSADGFLEPVGGSQALKRELERRYGKSLSEIKRKNGAGGRP
jgi:hypothetical protein